MGESSIDVLLINAVLPFIFFYAKSNGLDKIKDIVLTLYTQLKSEQNRYVKFWSNNNILSKSAYDSQSLLELSTELCLNKKCLECEIGLRVLRGGHENKK